MPDLTSLSIAALLFFGLLVGQATFRGDTMRVQISIAPKVVNTGFTDTIAEEVFAAEVSHLTEGDQLIPPPTVRIRSQAGVLGTLARPLAMEQVVAATQAMLGIDRLNVVAALTETAEDGEGGKPGLEMILVVAHQPKVTEQARIRLGDNDPVALVRRSASWSMELVAPYRVVLAAVLAATRGGAAELATARETAHRVLARTWSVEQSSERALVLNALALLSLLESDLAAAEMHLHLATLVPGTRPDILGVIRLNQAMLAVARKNPAQARRLLEQGLRQTSGLALPDFDVSTQIMSALADWSNDNLRRAEATLRSVAAAAPENEAAHFYLAQVLLLRGDAAGSAKALYDAQAARRFAGKQQPLVSALFWIDPINGGTKLRQ